MKAARGTLLVLTLAGVAAAQGRASLVDAPLAVLMSMPRDEVHALQSDFRQALARHQAVLLPTRSSRNSAVAVLGRNDCAVHDDCLQQLALASTSLYALFASIERNAAATELTVTGRVVDRDGRLVRARVRLTRAATGPAPAQDALQQLLLELQLDALPVVLTSRPVEGLAPPPLPELSSAPRPVRVAAWVTLGAAIGAAGASLGFGLSAATQLQGDRAVPIALGTGLGAGALLATSLVLFWVSGPVTIAAGPSAGGGAVFVRGRF